MKETLLQLLTCSSVAELQAAQVKESSPWDTMPIEGKSVLAIAAIKILNDHFSKDKKLWYLVEKKARKYILSNTGLSKDNLDKVLKTFQPMYQELVGVESEK